MSERNAVFRRLWGNRASSAAAIFMVATSAAVATTTFALADAALWRELPYRDASRLAMIITTHENGEAAVSLPDFHILRDKLTQARVAGAGSFALEYALVGFGDPRQFRGRQTTADFFDVLGVPMVAGRNFTRAEEKPGNWVVTITERMWNELFGRKPLAVANRSRRPRLRFTTVDRVLWAWLSQRWHGWPAALHVVQPATWRLPRRAMQRPASVRIREGSGPI